MGKKTLITGSVAYDVLVGYDGSFADAIEGADIEKLSVSFFAPRYARHHGGTGANIAWNLRLLGGEPLLVSTVGKDGGAYKALLNERGVDVSYLEERDDSITATAIIGTDTGERQIAFFHPGADAKGTWPKLEDERESIGYAIISPRNPVLMMQAVRWCAKEKIPFIFDPGQLIIGLSDDELLYGIKHASGVITNAYEWDLLSGRIRLNEKQVATQCGTLIVTKGEKGASIFLKGEKEKTIAPCKAETFHNPTGAGDAFRAGLLCGLEHGWNIEEGAELGAVLGSLVVGIEGTLLDTLDLDEVWARVEETYGHKLP